MSLALAIPEIFKGVQNSKMLSCDPDHGPVRDGLSWAGWDLLWSTCILNMKSLSTPVAKI